MAGCVDGLDGPARPVDDVSVADRLVGGPWDIASSPIEIEIPVAAAAVRSGRMELEIVSDPYVPAASGLADSRELGVVLSTLEFIPSTPGLDAPKRRP